MFLRGSTPEPGAGRPGFEVVIPGYPHHKMPRRLVPARIVEGINHGTSTGYVDSGCRCELCSRANTAHCRKVRSKAKLRPIKEHGIQAYTYQGCRCEVCRAAKVLENRIARSNEPRVLKPKRVRTLRHGTKDGYKQKCRCELCRAAASAYNKKSRLARLARRAASKINPPEGDQQKMIGTLDGP